MKWKTRLEYNWELALNAIGIPTFEAIVEVIAKAKLCKNRFKIKTQINWEDNFDF